MNLRPLPRKGNVLLRSVLKYRFKYFKQKKSCWMLVRAMVSAEKSVAGKCSKKILIAIAIALVLYGIFRILSEVAVHFDSLG